MESILNLLNLNYSMKSEQHQNIQEAHPVRQEGRNLGDRYSTGKKATVIVGSWQQWSKVL
jgi:hypothetical protein